MLCCNVKFIFLQNLIICSKDVFVTIALLKYILFLINLVWAVSFCFGLFVSFLIPCQFVPRGRGIWSQDCPQGLEVLTWFDQGLCQIPLSVPGLGGGGFNWLVHYFVFTLPNEIENNLIYLLHKFLIAAYHTCPVQENRNYECLDNLNSAKYRKITPPPDM